MTNLIKQIKIYVTNIPPSTLNLLKLEKFLLSKDGYKKYELVSEEFGTHIIEKEKMYRIEPNLNMELHLINNHKNDKLYPLLIDKTEYVHIPVISQFPVDYILTKMICFEYKINKKSGLKLIIDCLEETNKLLEKELIPINFYFLSSSINQSEDILLEEINMFLLELN
jgi:hypothetical protein